MYSNCCVLIIYFSTWYPKGSAAPVSTQETPSERFVGFHRPSLLQQASTFMFFFRSSSSLLLFAWFSMWKFKSPLSLISCRWKPKHTRSKYPSLPQRGVNGFASGRKGVTAVSKTDHQLSDQVIKPRKSQSFVYPSLPRRHTLLQRKKKKRGKVWHLDSLITEFTFLYYYYSYVSEEGKKIFFYNIIPMVKVSIFCSFS